MEIDIKEALRIRNRDARAYYKGLNFYSCKRTDIVTINQKLIKTAKQVHKAVAGTALFPNFLGSCSHAKSCPTTCILFAGQGQITDSKKLGVNTIDKAALRRLWLLKNKPDYFYAKLNHQLEGFMIEEETSSILWRETTSEVIDYNRVKQNPKIITYGYFKNPAKIEASPEEYQNDYKIYSWSELSRKHHIELCRENNIPIALVVPRDIFKDLLEESDDDIIFHNGSESDLQSHTDYVEGKINIHLLSKRNVRYNQYLTDTKFLNSYQKFFK